MKKSLDEIFAEKLDGVIDCVESKVFGIGLDFFDASINRIAVWVVDVRNMQKALLYAMLCPWAKLREMQERSEFTELMVEQELFKILPFGVVWEEFCSRNNVPNDGEWLKAVQEYEESILIKCK